MTLHRKFLILQLCVNTLFIFIEEKEEDEKQKNVMVDESIEFNAGSFLSTIHTMYNNNNKFIHICWHASLFVYSYIIICKIYI